MPDTSPPVQQRLWRGFKRHWPWLLVIAAGVYLFQMVYPSVDLDERSDPAPTVNLETLEGDRFQLSDHEGDVVVVSFWATWCPACRAELPFKQSLYEDYAEANEDVTFVGISINEAGLDAVREYADGEDLSFTQTADRSGLLPQFGGEGSIPATFIVDREGNIRFQHEGFLAKPALENAVDALLAE